MPRINRIRIVNFDYNNDTRHILDETFNFHGGENALLNLANGGGKSVLVQLFLQPVIPNAKIQGRALAGFFHKKSLPAYIMIEWKLDGGGGYLVTGMAVVSAEAGAEEERGRIRYCTFTSKYTAANPFDITNIPVVGRRGNLLEVLPFRQARELLADRERKDPISFGYYSEDDTERYRKVLAGFGIAQDEWRNVIARINDSEGGIEEIFQKYRNSGQLLNEWIIKTVEQAIFKSRTGESRLEEMLSGLVQEVIENERFIVEKQLLAGFLSRFGEQITTLDEMVKNIDEQGHLAGRLSALHTYLISETIRLQKQYDDNEQGIAACRTEEQRVQLEERSEAYLRKKAQHEDARHKLAAVETVVAETAEALQQANRDVKILAAARLAGEIAGRRAELAGIDERLSATKQQHDADGRLRSLEYSLRLLYENSLETLVSALAGLQENDSDRKRCLDEAAKELQAADQEKGLLDHECGELEVQRKHFEKEEREIMARLGLVLRRNLLGELEPVEVTRAGAVLGQARDGLAGEWSRLQAEKAAGAQRCLEIDIAVRDLRDTCGEEKASLAGIDREIAQYEQEEMAIGEILNRYGLAPELKFKQERLVTTFGQMLGELDARRDETARARDEAAEALRSLKNGRLHVPQEWAELLARLDIEYDTGESYLRRQAPELRQRLLEGNAVLPYAFIMSGGDIDRVAAAAGNMTARRVIPLIAYENLGMALESEGRLARTGEGVAFICLYEGRVFDSESLTGLVAEFERRRVETMEQNAHYTGAYEAAVSDRVACGRFGYAADYRHGLEQQQADCTGHLQELQSRISGLEEERSKLAARGEEIEQKFESLRESLRQAEERVVAFAVLIDREEIYQACRRRLDIVRDQIATLNAKKSLLAGRVNGFLQETRALEREIWQREQQRQDTEGRYVLYREAPAAETVAGGIDDLERRLKALKEQYSGNIALLEERKQQLEAECSRNQRDLRKLGLEQEAYAGAVYDEQTEERITGELANLEKQQQERQGELNRANRAEASAANGLQNALDEVRRLGPEEPLPPGEITGDFAERRRRARRRLQELAEDNIRIDRQRAEYTRLQERIEQAIDPDAVAPESGFTPEPDAGAQTAGLERLFRQSQEENRSADRRLREQYLALKAEYRDRDNLNIDNIFKGLDPLWERAADLQFDSNYYLYERMSQHADKLAELITIYENQLANLERNKRDLVQQSFLHGQMIYEEIQWISENSKVRLQGRTRPVQMMKIEMQHDTDEASLQRMAQYIEESVELGA